MGWGTAYTYEGYLNRITKREIDDKIEEIKEDNGIITFKYKGGVIDTAIEDVASNEEIIAIYNVLGQKLTTHRIEDLTHGTYIVKTATGTKKIAL